MFCYTCKKEAKLKEELHKATNDMIMVRGSCPFCNRWIKWIPYKYSEIVKKVLLDEYKKKE